MKNKHYLSKYVYSFFTDYLTRRRNLSKDTVKSYRDAVKLFFQFAEKKLNKSPEKLAIEDIKESIVIDFLVYLEKERGNLIKTRNQRLVALKSVFRHVSLQEPLLSEACRHIINIPSKRGAEITEISYLEKNEMDTIFKMIDTKTRLGRRDYAMLLLMYNTGARVQETADARLSWLSFTNPLKVEILGKGHKWRTCPLWDDTVKILQRFIAERDIAPPPDDFLFLNRFGNPFSRFGILYTIDKYKNKAALYLPGLKKKKVSPHTIRHTTAMHLLQSGVEINVIRSWLGHVDISTTNCYIEIDMAMKEKALKACEFKDKSGFRKNRLSDPNVLSWLESL